MRFFASVLFGCAMFSIPLAASAQQPVSRERVRAMLSGIEDLPSDDDWRRTGDAALPILMEIYNDLREPGFVRIRAIGASGAFPREATRTFLLAVARAEGQSDLFVREAVNAMARAFGRNAVSDLGPYLSHREPVVREATARAFGRIGGPDATRLLRARLSAERDEVVREAIQAALSR
jgi:HEAT repeat protein